MYELVQVSPQCYYINCPAKVGVYLAGENRVYLVDGGSDKDAGRKLRQILEKNSWQLQGILLTHSNADHTGGCRYLQSQTGCRVFAGGIEAAITAHPLLEPSLLWGGYPFKELRHKFLMAQECEVTPFDHPDFPKEIKIIPLPGHFFDMVGFCMPDGCTFLADCISSRETLEKYAVSFIYDVQAYLDTLDAVEKMEGNIFVPAHAEAGADLSELIDFNRSKVYEIAKTLLDICVEPMNFESVLQKIFAHYNLTMTAQQYVLVGSTIKSYLSWLKEGGRMKMEIDNNMLLWQTI